MSYTLYLIHQPVFIAISPSSVGWSLWLIDVVRIVIIVPIVIASWFLIEKPLMQWRRKAL
jgi:peptidoglycan/LPS O-acetylase OafA/YrhL